MSTKDRLAAAAGGGALLEMLIAAQDGHLDDSVPQAGEQLAAVARPAR